MLYKYNNLAVEFLPFFICIAYFIFSTVYHKEYEKMSNDVILDRDTLFDYLFNKKIAKCKFILENRKLKKK